MIRKIPDEHFYLGLRLEKNLLRRITLIFACVKNYFAVQARFTLFKNSCEYKTAKIHLYRAKKERLPVTTSPNFLLTFS